MAGRTRCLLLSLLAAACIAPAPSAAVDVVAGLKGGWTSTDLAGGSGDARSGGVFGIAVGWEINRWLSFHVDPVWTRKGADLENFQVGEFKSAVVLDYFELPLLGKFKYLTSPQFGSGGPFGVFGPTIGINTRAHVRVAGGEDNIAEHVHDADFGLTFGAGYDFVVASSVTTIEVRYVLGLVDVFESDAPSPEATADRQNRALQITVGLSKSIF